MFLALEINKRTGAYCVEQRYVHVVGLHVRRFVAYSGGINERQYYKGLSAVPEMRNSVITVKILPPMFEERRPTK